ncbi:hypothetical protein MKX08_007694, partial [Trichoderma sp. CBMAI-0020]
NTPPPLYTSCLGIAPISVLLTINNNTKSCIDRIRKINYYDLIEKFKHYNIINSSLIFYIIGLFDNFKNIIKANRTADEDYIMVRCLTLECISYKELEKEDKLY